MARAIVASGSADYYRLRTALPSQGRELVPSFLDQLAVYDHPAVQRTMVRDAGDLKEAALLLENLSCAACVWLAERSVGAVEGVAEFSINYATRRALVRWDPQVASLSRVLTAIAAIGFTAHPYDRERAQEGLARERRDRLLRFLVAGALGMQVMTLAVALYAGAFSGMEEPFRRFFRWTSLLLTAPVLLYSARPFFAGAFRDLSHRRVGMDVPVALGLTLAYFGSVWATIADRGEVYFDSVVMFVFLLLGARVIELLARERAVREQESVVRSVPTTARRLAGNGSESIVATVELAVGDRVRVLPGESVPADGVIEGRTLVARRVAAHRRESAGRAGCRRAGDRRRGQRREPARAAGHRGGRGDGALFADESGGRGARREARDRPPRRPGGADLRARNPGAGGGAWGSTGRGPTRRACCRR